MTQSLQSSSNQCSAQKRLEAHKGPLPRAVIKGRTQGERVVGGVFNKTAGARLDLEKAYFSPSLSPAESLSSTTITARNYTYIGTDDEAYTDPTQISPEKLQHNRTTKATSKYLGLSANKMRYINPTHIDKLLDSTGTLRVSETSLAERMELSKSIGAENAVFMEAHDSRIKMQYPQNPTRQHYQGAQKTLLSKSTGATVVGSNIFSLKKAGAYQAMTGGSMALGSTISYGPSVGESMDIGPFTSDTLTPIAGAGLRAAGGVVTKGVDAGINAVHERRVTKNASNITDFIVNADNYDASTHSNTLQDLAVLLTLERSKNSSRFQEKIKISHEGTGIADASNAIQAIQEGGFKPGDVEGVAIEAIVRSNRGMVDKFLEMESLKTAIHYPSSR